MAFAIRTPRLLLREWRDDDVAPFAAMSADSKVMEFLASFVDRAAIDAYIAAARGHLQIHGFGKFAVELPGEASFIGMIGLDHVRAAVPFAPAIEAVWRLAPAYWGRGYALEAARAAVEDGFARFDLHEIVAYTTIDNRRSRQVMERLGMIHDATEDFDFRHPRSPQGQPPRRCVLYRMRRDGGR
jgi:RimJ/RimL family protein N-acetyltransferase